jgi:hypothetical protein
MFCTFFPVQYLFSLSSFPHLNLAIIFLSFALSFRRYFGISSVIHLSYSLLHLDSLILPFFLAYLSFSLSLSSTFIHLHFALILPILHWHTRSSGSNNLSPSSPCSFSFLSSIPLVSCTLPFHPFCLQTLPLSFPLSLSAYSSSLTRYVTWRFSLPLLVPQISALHIIILPLKTPIPKTHLTTLFAFLHYLSYVPYPWLFR